MPTLAHPTSPGPAPAAEPEPWQQFPAIPRAEVLRLRRIDWASPRRAAERDAILALSAEREQWAALALAMWADGHRAGVAATAGYCAGHQQAVADARAAGQRQAHADSLAAFDAGFAACWQRFAAEIATRSRPPRPRRHRPLCGNRDCARAECQPRRREPYDQAACQRKARESWGLPAGEAEYAAQRDRDMRLLSAQMRALGHHGEPGAAA